MVLAAYHRFYAWNLGVSLRFLENMRTRDAEEPGVDLHVLKNSAVF